MHHTAALIAGDIDRLVGIRDHLTRIVDDTADLTDQQRVDAGVLAAVIDEIITGHQAALHRIAQPAQAGHAVVAAAITRHCRAVTDARTRWDAAAALEDFWRDIARAAAEQP